METGWADTVQGKIKYIGKKKRNPQCCSSSEMSKYCISRDDRDGRNSRVSVSSATSSLFPSIIFIKMGMCQEVVPELLRCWQRESKIYPGKGRGNEGCECHSRGVTLLLPPCPPLGSPWGFGGISGVFFQSTSVFPVYISIFPVYIRFSSVYP